MVLDQTDLEIIRWLQGNSRLQWKEIGEKVHLTGQAVAARINRMEDLGVIEGFTLKLNLEKLGRPMLGLVTVFMKTADHKAFLRFIEGREEVLEGHRVSGEGCYWLKISVKSQDQLNRFLNEILGYGNYRVNLSIGRVK